MKKTKRSFKKINLKKFTIADLDQQNSIIGGTGSASNRCTSIRCGNYECAPRETV